jgi:hypothetical protein
MNAANRKAAYAVLERIKNIVEAGHEVRFIPGICNGSDFVVGVGGTHFHTPSEWSGTTEEFVELLDKQIRMPGGGK